VATECSWNDGSKTQYYIVILDRLQDRSGGVEQALESQIRGPLTACVLCLDLLSCMWLHILGELNCCQEFRREVVFRLIGVRIEHIKDVNL